MNPTDATRHMTFVAAVNNRQVLQGNLLASPCLQGGHGHQVVLQEKFSSASSAYNDAIDKSVNDLIVFCHQDIYLPEAWPAELERSLSGLASTDANWGVLGCYGETLDDHGRGYVYSSGRGVMGSPFDHPAAVQTLDEIVLILRKSSGLRFDPLLPHFHFYGTDICMAAAKRGMKSYAISAFCVHNTQQYLILPKEFYESCDYVKRAWRDWLPIQTTCVRLTKAGFPLRAKRLREVYLRHVRRKTTGGTRVESVHRLLEEVMAGAGPE
jgi:hypothetical protein